MHWLRRIEARVKVVTTVHKAGFEQYGYRWFESLRNWPDRTQFFAYCEGFKTQDYIGCWPGADPTRDHCWIDAERPPTDSLWRLSAFKERHKDYRPPSWRHDIVRFAHKVFAAHKALYEHDGIGVWLDADCVTYKPIPEGYIEGLLGDAYFAHFNRVGHYTETGMWIVNCAHPEHRAFMDTWLNWFESDAFKGLHEWHDCTTLDATLRMFLRDGRITTKSLSGEFERDMHPMAMADTAQYIDHCKGRRKEIGFSPENKQRSKST